MPLKLTDQCELQSIENTVRISDGPSFCVDVLYDRQHYIDKRVSVVLVVGVGIHTDSAFMAHYLGCTTPYTIKQLMHILVSIHTLV